ncbi:MAG: T9SS type A sorting domain-containing protein, partial [Chitinophagales bacterium]|nr:T9SS type A sorting domain-containing protein [Chitinophagales bacterium]
TFTAFRNDNYSRFILRFVLNNHVSSTTNFSDADVRVDIYPNPAHNTVFFNCKFMIADDIIDIGIFDLSGRQIQLASPVEHVSKSLLSLNIDELPPAVYTVKVTTKNHIFVHKLIKHSGK